MNQFKGQNTCLNWTTGADNIEVKSKPFKHIVEVIFVFVSMAT